MISYMKMSLSSMLMVGSLFTSCTTPAEDLEKAQDNEKQSKKELRIAKQEYEKEMTEYRKTSEEKIAANELKIAEFKARVKTQKEEAKAD